MTCALTRAQPVIADPLVAADTRTYVFVCPDETRYVVRTEQDEAWLFLSGATLRLKAVADAKSARYAGPDAELVIDDQTARLTLAGKGAPVCRNDPQLAVWEHAKLDGVDFRAEGNEPPSVLEFCGQTELILTTDYGATRIERPLPPMTPLIMTPLEVLTWKGLNPGINCEEGVANSPAFTGSPARVETEVPPQQGDNGRHKGHPLHAGCFTQTRVSQFRCFLTCS